MVLWGDFSFVFARRRKYRKLEGGGGRMEEKTEVFERESELGGGSIKDIFGSGKGGGFS